MKILGHETRVIVPWHNPSQIEDWERTWNCQGQEREDLVLFQHDANKEGCAITKNKGIDRACQKFGAEILIILDDDCYPADSGYSSLSGFAELHVKELLGKGTEPPPDLISSTTNPPARGTPYGYPPKMEVAASMGFWSNIGDYDAVHQLVYGPTHPMEFHRKFVRGRYFPLCGMNLAFHKKWLPYAYFIDVPRFDDIWMGWLFQKIAFSVGACFSLRGPIVCHSRQSNVWQNLRDEARFLEANETLWHKIATHPLVDYDSLAKLIDASVKEGGTV